MSAPLPVSAGGSQFNSMALPPFASAVRLVGAPGGVGVVADASSDGIPGPLALIADTL